MPELTIRAILLGAVLGIVFGAASVYLGLRMGIPTSVSIPIAVMAITILKVLGMGEQSLTFAVGVYLPISSTLPIYIGGVIRKIADRAYKRKPDDVEEAEGTLMSSGLVAGGALVGVLAAFLHFVPGMKFDDENTGLPLAIAIGYKYLRFLWDMDWVSVIAFSFLGYLLFRGAAPRKN